MSNSDLTVMISDPPWTFLTRSAKGGKKSPKYSVMPLSELHQLSPCIKELAGRNCVHLMWTTFSQLENAMALMATWGFQYKTARVWDKQRPITGYWAMCDAEIVLIGTRGKFKLPAGTKRRTLFKGTRVNKEHSSKPEELHTWVEQGYPDQRKIELFARDLRSGWECYGDELGTLLTPSGAMNIGAVTKPEKAHAKTEVDTQGDRQGKRRRSKRKAVEKVGSGPVQSGRSAGQGQ